MKLWELFGILRYEAEFDFSDFSIWAQQPGFNKIKVALREIRKRKYHTDYYEINKFLTGFIESSKSGSEENVLALFILGASYLQLYKNEKDEKKVEEYFKKAVEFLIKAKALLSPSTPPSADIMENCIENRSLFRSCQNAHLDTMIAFAMISKFMRDHSEVISMKNIKSGLSVDDDLNLAASIDMLKNSIKLDSNYLPPKILLVYIFMLCIKFGIEINPRKSFQLDREVGEDWEEEADEQYYARKQEDEKIIFETFQFGTTVEGLYPSIIAKTWKYLGHCYKTGLGTAVDFNLAEQCLNNYRIIKKNQNIFPLSMSNHSIITKPASDDGLILQNKILLEKIEKLNAALFSCNVRPSDYADSTRIVDISHCKSYCPSKGKQENPGQTHAGLSTAIVENTSHFFQKS